MVANVSPVHAGRPTLPPLSADQLAKMGQGKVALTTRKDGETGKAVVTGVAQIKAPHESIWSIILDSRHSKTASSAVKEVLTHQDTTAPDGTRTMAMEWHLRVALSSIKYHTIRIYHPRERYLNWSIDRSKKSDIADTTGSYSTHDSNSPGTVFLLYSARIDTGRNIPDWLEEDLTESGLKKYLQYVKRVAEGGK